MKHLIRIGDLERADIERILARAQGFEEILGRDVKKVPALRGRTVAHLFYEASTRTSSSFELAAKRLSADIVTVRATGSSVEKGESLKDTVMTLTAYGPAVIVIRSPDVGAADCVAEVTDASVVNAGDGKHAHPTQALLDAYALGRRVGSLEGLNIWIVGDVLHSRVARSCCRCFRKLGARVTLCGPPTLMPPRADALAESVAFDLRGVHEADVVYVLRMQSERMEGVALLPSLREYVRSFQISAAALRPGQLVMHPGPVNRGVELTPDVIDGPSCLIAEQVECGLYVRMAVLYELMTGQAKPARRSRLRQTAGGAA